MAIVQMKKTGVTKKALIAAGVAGVTAVKVQGRGNIITDPERIEECKRKLLAMGADEFSEAAGTEKEIMDFLDGSRFFPRRLFTILVHDEDVPRVVEAIENANRTPHGIGDGTIFVLPVIDAIRVRTGESGESAIW